MFGLGFSPLVVSILGGWFLLFFNHRLISRGPLMRHPIVRQMVFPYLENDNESDLPTENRFKLHTCCLFFPH